MKSPIDAKEVEAQSGGSEVDPNDKSLPPHKTFGPFETRHLGDYFGLTQFGAKIETLQPGSKSSLRHWHTRSDEFVLMLDGELTLVTDEGETLLTSGMIAGFKAGDENGHHLINRSDEAASFFVVGSRMRGDVAHYPDDDLQWLEDKDGTWYAARGDGTRY